MHTRLLDHDPRRLRRQASSPLPPIPPAPYRLTLAVTPAHATHRRRGPTAAFRHRRSTAETTYLISLIPSAPVQPQGIPSACRSTPRPSNALSVRNGSPVHITCGLISGPTLTSDHSCAQYAARPLHDSMTGSATRVSIQAKRSSSARATYREAGTGAVGAALRVPMHWAATSGLKQAVSVSSLFWTRNPWSASASS